MFVIRVKETGDLAIMGGDPEEKFAKKNLCECYDQYGNTIGCYNAGCYSADNSDSDYPEYGTEEQHTECKAYDYWDGHNWQSIIAECFDVPEAEDVEILRWGDEDDVKLEKEILSEYENTVFPAEFKQGYRMVVVDGWEFTESLWQGDYALAWAKKIRKD